MLLVGPARKRLPFALGPIDFGDLRDIGDAKRGQFPDLPRRRVLIRQPAANELKSTPLGGSAKTATRFATPPYEVRRLERASGVRINRQDNDIGVGDRFATTRAHPAARKTGSRRGRTATTTNMTRASVARTRAHHGHPKILLRFMGYAAQSRHRPTSSTICRCGAKPARLAASCNRRSSLTSSISSLRPHFSHNSSAP